MPGILAPKFCTGGSFHQAFAIKSHLQQQLERSFFLARSQSSLWVFHTQCSPTLERQLLGNPRNWVLTLTWVGEFLRHNWKVTFEKRTAAVSNFERVQQVGLHRGVGLTISSNLNCWERWIVKLLPGDAQETKFAGLNVGLRGCGS